MDLAFVFGPANLEYAVKQSRDGYIGFLTIIDVATKQLWTFMIKNKDTTTQYINTFLKQHSIRQTDPSKKIITTS